MMEIDQSSYIFGSFSRRRQSREVHAKRHSIEASSAKVSHARSNSAPHSAKHQDAAALFTSYNTISVSSLHQDEGIFKCPMCQKCYVDPRVLPCLHTFCIKCLQELEASFVEEEEESAAESIDSRHGSGGSGGSGYGSDKLNSPPKNGFPCPVCGVWVLLSPQGVQGLHPHYLLQHRMILATLNSPSTRLLCDTCIPDIPAGFRCTECALSLCQTCAVSHSRTSNSNTQHSVLRLEEARKRGITRVRRQVMCYNHPESELCIFCTVCCEVICRDCVSTSHKSHPCESASHAAKVFSTGMSETLEKVRFFAKQANSISSRLQAELKRVETRCNQVQEEIDNFMEAYLRAIEDHRKTLSRQVTETRAEKVRAIEERKIQAEKRLRDVKDVILFTEELLNDGTDVEVLSFLKPVLDKLDKCSKLEGLSEGEISENLQFLPNEEVSQVSPGFCSLYGVITTQTVSASRCALKQDGLQNLRIGKRAEALLLTCDSNNTPLQRGGETVEANLRHRDAGISRSIHVQVKDQRDGSYVISFTPDVSGKLLLHVAVNGQQIKDSPFPIIIRSLRPHQGTFHCCSFCSSGGSKEVGCGCGGKMPGGYRGCGHGHDGHPGRRHWSCCGNVLEHSECVRANSTHYQFTL